MDACVRRLFRIERLASVCPAGLLFGVANQDIVKHTLHHLMAVEPKSSSLLSTDSGKKGVMKQGDVPVGPVMHVSARHSDGDPMQLTVQVRWSTHRMPPVNILSDGYFQNLWRFELQCVFRQAEQAAKVLSCACHRRRFTRWLP